MRKKLFFIWAVLLCMSTELFAMKNAFDDLLPKTFEKKCKCTIVLHNLDGEFYGKMDQAIIQHKLFFGNVEIPTTTETSYVSNNSYTKIFPYDCKELYNVFGAEAMEAQLPKTVMMGRAAYEKPPCAVLLKVQLQFASGKKFAYFSGYSLDQDVPLAKISNIEQLNQNYYINLRTLENDKGTAFQLAGTGVHIELQQNASNIGYAM